jgi:hypothetical protein
MGDRMDLERRHSFPALNRGGIAKYGERQAINDLAEAGLVNQGVVLPTRLSNDSPNDFVLRYGDHLLRIQTVSGQEIVPGTPLSGLRLTRTGREIASVLAQQVDAEYFVDAGQWLSNLWARVLLWNGGVSLRRTGLRYQ